jgi:cyclopropane-fatty-acyl-phospholipid synthase
VTDGPRSALPEPVAARISSAGFPLAVQLPDGRAESFGAGEPLLEVRAVNERGVEALCSLKELEVVEAYMRGDIDLEGDLLAAMDLRDVLSDTQLHIKAWTFLQPLIFGRKRLNPGWIAKHYDSENMQLFATDETYNVYTPGVYLSDDDSLEEGAERKLEYAFESLGLRAGDSVLDVGCGWGGFVRYCAARGVAATGISLSRHQLDFARRRLDEDGLQATLLYQDFFTYEPGRRFDAISLMGVIEDLSDYDKVMGRLSGWLRPGGRIYLDFAAVDRRFGVPSFVTKYVWPGAFRMVYLPSFTRALAKHHLDMVEMLGDRRNYYLWVRGGYERWMRLREEIVEAAGEETWRMMRLLMAGTAHVMSERSARATAYRVVLRPRAAGPAAGAARDRGEATLASGSPP